MFEIGHDRFGSDRRAVPDITVKLSSLRLLSLDVPDSNVGKGILFVYTGQILLLCDRLNVLSTTFIT